MSLLLPFFHVFPLWSLLQLLRFLCRIWVRENKNVFQRWNVSQLQFQFWSTYSAPLRCFAPVWHCKVSSTILESARIVWIGTLLWMHWAFRFACTNFLIFLMCALMKRDVHTWAHMRNATRFAHLSSVLTIVFSFSRLPEMKESGVNRPRSLGWEHFRANYTHERE